jgi:hypothetical protein
MKNQTLLFMALPALMLAGCNTRDTVSSLPAAYTSGDIDNPGGSGGGTGGMGGSGGSGGYGGCAGEGGSGGGGMGGEGGSGGMGGEGGSGGGDGCTLTQGYWKNHEKAWPVSELKLGDVIYTKSELLEIMRTPPAGNGLLSMAHQLIAARLNMASAASGGGIEMTLAAADAMIGSLVIPPKGDGFLSPDKTSTLNDELAAFNEGKVGPGHCDDGPSREKPPEVLYNTPVCDPPTTTTTTPPTYPPGTLE